MNGINTCNLYIIIQEHSHSVCTLPFVEVGVDTLALCVCSLVRRQCAEFVSLAISSWNTAVLEKALSLLEETVRKGLKDADAQARKHMRRCG